MAGVRASVGCVRECVVYSWRRKNGGRRRAVHCTGRARGVKKRQKTGSSTKVFRASKNKNADEIFPRAILVSKYMYGTRTTTTTTTTTKASTAGKEYYISDVGTIRAQWEQGGGAWPINARFIATTAFIPARGRSKYTWRCLHAPLLWAPVAKLKAQTTYSTHGTIAPSYPSCQLCAMSIASVSMLARPRAARLAP